MSNELVPKKKKALTVKEMKLKKAIQHYQKKGFYSPTFELVDNYRQLKWLYLYFTNGFKGKEAYEKAGYKASKHIPQCIASLKTKLAVQIADLIKNSDYLSNELDADLHRISNTTLAEFEPFISGEKTLQELADEGVDLSALKSVIKGYDRDGNPYAKVDIESAAQIKLQLKKLLQNAEREIGNQINIAEQTIHIHTNVPSYDTREKKAKKQKQLDDVIDVEVEDKE